MVKFLKIRKEYKKFADSIKADRDFINSLKNKIKDTENNDSIVCGYEHGKIKFLHISTAVIITVMIIITSFAAAILFNKKNENNIVIINNIAESSEIITDNSFQISNSCNVTEDVSNQSLVIESAVSSETSEEIKDTSSFNETSVEFQNNINQNTEADDEIYQPVTEIELIPDETQFTTVPSVQITEKETYTESEIPAINDIQTEMDTESTEISENIETEPVSYNFIVNDVTLSKTESTISDIVFSDNFSWNLMDLQISFNTDCIKLKNIYVDDANGNVIPVFSNYENGRFTIWPDSSEQNYFYSQGVTIHLELIADETAPAGTYEFNISGEMVSHKTKNTHYFNMTTANIIINE